MTQPHKAGEPRPPVEAAAAGFMPAVEEHFAGGEGLTLEGLMAQLGEVWGLVEGALHGAGGELAAGLCAWFTQPGAEGSIGEGVGWLAGTLVFEVLLALATAGTWTAVSGSIKTIARILDWTGEALGAAFKLLGKLGGELIQGVKSVARMVSDGAGGALKAFLTSLEEIGAKLMAYADELLGRVGRSGVDEGVERGAKKGGEELGEEGVERGAKKGADDASPKPKADDAEKQRVALEARLVSQAMESAGRGVQEIVAALQASFMVRYPWIRDFTAEPRGLGWRIFLIASKKVVDDVGDGTAQLSEKGRSSPVALTPEELHRVLEWQGARDSYLKRWRERDLSMVSEEDLRLLDGKPDRAIRKSMTPDDAAAVLKEGRGVQIPKATGEAFDHLSEGRGARKAVINGIHKIQERLKTLTTQQEQSRDLYMLLENKLSDLSVLLDQYERATGWPWSQNY